MSRRLRQSGRRRSGRRLWFEPLEERRLLTTFTVTSTQDSGAGSLRQAILDANASPDGGVIEFGIPLTDPNFIDVDVHVSGGDAAPDAWLIQPQTELPALGHPTASIVIDGRTQTAAGGDLNPFGPEIVLDGNGLFARGIFITSGDHLVAGLNIQRFGRSGINIFGGDRNIVVGNYIGVDASGTAAAGNERSGVTLEGGAARNRIGTDGDGINDDGERNVIGGNLQAGVLIAEIGTDENVVAGNFIGTNAAGNEAIGNFNRGVDINDGAKNNRIGSSGDGVNDIAQRNLISGNKWDGVGIHGSGTSLNVVAGNLIGTDVTGTVDLGNAFRGVTLFLGASQSTIGGGQPGLRNIISGNDTGGVIMTTGATQNTVAGNYIGADFSGLFAVGNTLSGVRMGNGATGNVVGTNSDGLFDELEGNLIAANTEYGVLMTDAGTANNIVAGNFIGTDATGTADLGNGFRGVAIEAGAGFARLGGSNPAARNLISGNGTGGIRITGSGLPGGTGNVVTGNYIGTDLTGSLAIANNGFGILLEPGSPGNRIGTDGDGQNDAAEGNLISGNNNSGVRMIGLGTDGNIVAGNRIGTNATGTAALSNNGNGVSIGQGATGNRVGTNGDGVSDTQERNLLSGNLSRGVLLSDAGTSGNVVAGNYIGTSASATGAVGNTLDGVQIQAGAKSNRIGTNGDGQGDAAERNVISGNLAAGVNILNTGTTDNVVAGNSIGTDAAGAADLGNVTDGVRIQMSAENNPVVGNTIAFNKRIGVSLSSAGSGNAIVGNSIYANAQLGIDLDADGATPNDAGDADEGPNRTQNMPEIDEIIVGRSALRVTYSVPTDLAHSNYPLRVEFFLADADGQEGKTFLGADVFSADDLAAGVKTVIFTPAATVKSGDPMVATPSDTAVTGLAANTSEFSVGHVVVTNPWFSPSCNEPLDVTGDCGVFAEDALDVINYLNAFGARPVPVLASGPPFYDTNGDFFVTAADALDVINYLNAFGPVPGPEPEASGQAAVDAVLGSLNVSRSLASTAAAEAIYAADNCTESLVLARARRNRRG